MKLVIQIPAWNEEATLPRRSPDLPRDVPGFTLVAWLVVDDGSDRRHRAGWPAPTVSTAWSACRCTWAWPRRSGPGWRRALDMGADVVVNTDADHQYRGGDVARVAAPVRAGEADLVVGERDPRRCATPASSAWVGRRPAGLGTSVRDATSGLRAFSRDAARRLEVTSTFTYTVETLIRAGRGGMAVTGVPVSTNPATRPSRLFASPWTYVGRTGPSILRLWLRA